MTEPTSVFPANQAWKEAPASIKKYPYALEWGLCVGGEFQWAGYNRYALQSNLKWGECSAHPSQRPRGNIQRSWWKQENPSFRGSETKLQVGPWEKLYWSRQVINSMECPLLFQHMPVCIYSLDYGTTNVQSMGIWSQPNSTGSRGLNFCICFGFWNNK